MSDPTLAGKADYGIAPSGYRLPPATRLGTVRLQVADLARSLEWYQRVLGATVLERDAASAGLGAADGRQTLIELRERKAARPMPRRGRLGLYHYAILLPDRAELGRLLGHLMSIGERAGMSDHLVSEALYLSDPDGLGVEVYADRPRGEWTTRDRQLAMATDPLDTESLLRAGEGRAWEGLPAGTVVGHAHLYVEDLRLAEAFYHTGLGLDKVVWSYPGALFMSVGGYHHHLGTNTWAVGAEPAGPDDARLLQWELIVPTAADVAAALRNLESSGFTVDRGSGTVADPWGTVLRLRTS